MLLRPATAQDVGAIHALVQSAYAPWVPVVGRRPGPMDADYAALVAGGDVSVLADPEIVAVLVLVPDADALMVENVAVAPGHQGRGLGRALLEHAEDVARERDIAELRLYTHERMTANIELYGRLGWAEYDRRESDGFARVFMRKRVAPR